ncbi:MAG: methyltransferase domain-containing protein [Methylococcales bacterium]|nr:methyltransferase domain-containing protein [Methylococcales bacterium]
MKKVLNVGGSSKSIPLPPQYEGWDHVLLDIDPKGNPDVLCDARELITLPESVYDSVFCSHNLEHYYHHDAKKVLAGFSHVLKADGFVFIIVPDMYAVMQTMIEKNLDIKDVLYQSPAGPIKVRDVIYGYGVQIERSGCDFFAHKTGFTQKSLTEILDEAGFSWIFTGLDYLEIFAFAFKDEPSDYLTKLLNITKP